MNGSRSSWTKLGRKCESAFKHVLLFFVGLYRMIGSPLMGGACRFEPSCSEYAVGALHTHKPLRASGTPFLIIAEGLNWSDTSEGFASTPWRWDHQYRGGVLTDAALHH